MQENLIRTNVTVIGGGLAGMASAIHLARAGFQVVCIEPAAEDGGVVGESLDWSAPDLLRALGLPMERLLADDIATWKKHVTVQMQDGCVHHYVPGEWLARSPWNVELRTLHVDRIQLRKALSEILLHHGVSLIQDRVSEVERTGKKVTGVKTESGKQIESPWFIDASGFAASLFPRLFRLPAFEYGPRKVAIWSYFTVPDAIEGTTLYMDANSPPYMDWVWEIPIHRNTISVGYVAPGEAIREMRQRGQTVEDIFIERMRRFARFEPLLQTQEGISAQVTSFRCRVHRKIAGPNWLVVGEAASMVDPMTSNGVTAALRHADESSRLIVRSFHRQRLPYVARTLYSRRVLELSRFFNSGIEKVIYECPVRNAIGVGNAGEVYTIPAWLMNAVYSRVRPRGVIGTSLFCLLLTFLRWSASVFNWLCRRGRQLTPSPAAVAS
jgi:flavin-dependent dehydrogenase